MTSMGSKAAGQERVPYRSFVHLARQAASWSSSGVVTILATGATSRAEGISADGSTIVGYDLVGGGADAWAYRNGVQYFLPHNFVLGGDSSAMDSSADGSVVVGIDAVGGDQHAVIWSGNSWAVEQDLGTIATLAGDSAALGVNADGSIIVGNSDADDFLSHAFYWHGGVMNDLGVTGFVSSAEDISAEGLHRRPDHSGFSIPRSWNQQDRRLMIKTAFRGTAGRTYYPRSYRRLVFRLPFRYPPAGPA